MANLSDIFQALANGGTSKLPSDMQERTIIDMEEGETGYTAPWAMFANSERELYIVGSYPVSKNPGGTVCMKIKKSEGNVLVDRSSIRCERYTPKEPHYVGVTPNEYIPVLLVAKV